MGNAYAPRKNVGKQLREQVQKQKDLQSGKKKNALPEAFQLDPSKTSNILKNLMTLASMPKCVTEDDYITRFNDYFNFCIEQEIKPTIESFSLAFGIVPSTFTQRWAAGESGAFKKDLALKAKAVMQSFLTNAVMEGSVNPVTYIFYSKNYYGMVDKVEHVQNTGTEQSVESKRELLEALPDTDVYE